MTLTVPSSVTAAYATGKVVRRTLIRFDLGSGTYRFWDGAGPLDYDGATWQPGAGLITVKPMERSTQGEVVAVELALRSIPDTALSPDVLGTIHDEDWHQRPVQISTLYIDPDTRAAINHIVKFTGKLDVIDDKTEPANGIAELRGKAESYLRDLTRRGYAKASDVQQQALFAGDKFFEHAAVAGVQKFAWGRNTPASFK